MGKLLFQGIVALLIYAGAYAAFAPAFTIKPKPGSPLITATITAVPGDGEVLFISSTGLAPNTLYDVDCKFSRNGKVNHGYGSGAWMTDASGAVRAGGALDRILRGETKKEKFDCWFSPHALAPSVVATLTDGQPAEIRGHIKP